MRFTSSVALVVSAAAAVFAGSACLASPVGPSAEEGAAHLGLVAGTTLTYASSNGTTETHTYGVSDVQSLGALTVARSAKESGFAVDDRSLTFGVDVAQATILRYFNCLSQCATFDAPLSFVQWPLEEGARTEGEVVVTESRNGEVVQVRTERHATTVSALVDVVVPAGTFAAHLVNWSRTIIDGTGVETSKDTTTLQWAPDVGIIKYEADGLTLELSSR